MFHICTMASSLIWPYLFSYFASSTTHRMTLIGNTVFDSNWFDYPSELQKYMILIIARSQYPSQFTGLGLYDCTLKEFGNVRFLQFILKLDLILTLLRFKITKSSFSFYMVFRKLSNK